jgi:hypothetical protein
MVTASIDSVAELLIRRRRLVKNAPAAAQVECESFLRRHRGEGRFKTEASIDAAYSRGGEIFPLFCTRFDNPAAGWRLNASDANEDSVLVATIAGLDGASMLIARPADIIAERWVAPKRGGTHEMSGGNPEFDIDIGIVRNGGRLRWREEPRTPFPLLMERAGSRSDPGKRFAMTADALLTFGRKRHQQTPPKIVQVARLRPDIIFETLRNPKFTLPREKDANRACLLHSDVLNPSYS